MVQGLVSRRSKLAIGIAAAALLAGWAPPATSIDWSARDAAALVDIIGAADREGLEPRDYGAAAVEAAIASGDDAAIDAAATRAALALAGDYAAGRVPPDRRVGWHIAGPVRSDVALAARIGAGLRARRLEEAFEGLLPTHPEYRRLREALHDTGADEAARRAQLRVNLERWRWMPRDLGRRYILVNVPAFSLKLIEGDRTVDERAVIVGKRATPTPQFSAQVSGVILNPWWEVPKSIVAESVGELIRRHPSKAAAQGYVVQAGPGGAVRVRQKPGPGNALGQMKLVMPNPFSVYLHDTPSRARFEQEDRALSHGCIRVKGAVDFAAMLLEDDPTWNRGQIDRVLSSGTSTKVELGRTVPVHIGYFTAATKDGRLAYFADPYNRDAGVLRELDRRAPAALASRAADAQCPA